MTIYRRNPIMMEFGILLFVLVQLTTIQFCQSSVAISNSSDVPKEPIVNATQQENVNKTESVGFIKQMTTQMENLACKVGLFCEKKAEEKVETNKEKSDEKQKVGRAESPANSSSIELGNSPHHDPAADKKSEMRKPESEASASTSA